MVQQFFEKGVEFYNKEELRKAEKQFNKALKIDPSLTLALSYKGLILVRLGKYALGLDLINKALKQNSSIAEIWVHKALSLRKMKNYEESVKCFYEALKIEPNRWWTDLARTHEFFKHYKEALECIEKALIHNPNNDLYRKMKYALSGGIKYKDNYYTGIFNIQFLKNLGLDAFMNEIVYSSPMSIKWISHYTYSTRIYNPKGHAVKKKILTDVYFTNKGLICKFPVTRRSEVISVQFIPWSEARFSFRGNIKIGPAGEEAFRFKLLRNPRYESYEAFNIRKKNFENEIKELVDWDNIPSKQKIEIPESKPLTKDDTSHLTKDEIKELKKRGYKIG